MTRSNRVVIAWAAVGAVLLGLAWAIGAADAARPVIVLNPLGEPVTVRLGGTEVRIPAAGRARAEVATGAVAVEVRGQDGRVIDRHRLHVPASEADQAIYAVLGAAPLFRVNVIYTSRSVARGPESRRPSGFELLVGKRFQVVRADYVLEKPPEQIEMPTNSTQTVKTLVDVAPGGWERALQLAPEAFGGVATADALARALHRALPGEWYPLGLAIETSTLLEGPEAGAALAEAAVDAAPESAEWHRAYIYTMRQAGRVDELRRRYRARAARTPASPLANAMLLRVLPRAEAEPAARAALAAFPDDRQVQLAAAYVLLRTGHPADAAAVFARIPLGPSEDNGWVDSQVRALLLAGRKPEAAQAALAAARVHSAAPRYPALYAQVARLPGVRPEVDPEALLREWAGDRGEAAVAWVNAQLGTLDPADAGRVGVGPNPAALSITAWATRDPTQALERCRKAGDAALLALPEDVGLLLALEARRAGDRALYRRLALRVPLGEADVAAWIDRGVEPEEAWRLSEDEWAAFALARARRLEAGGQQVPLALTLAARGDLLQGPAYFAAIRWHRAPRAAPPVQLVLQPLAPATP